VKKVVPFPQAPQHTRVQAKVGEQIEITGRSGEAKQEIEIRSDRWVRTSEGEGANSLPDTIHAVVQVAAKNVSRLFGARCWRAHQVLRRESVHFSLRCWENGVHFRKI
jgi:hypothetical protein